MSISEKIIGIAGYDCPIVAPDTKVSFIFARKLFGLKGYSSKHEACQIDGVYFAGRNYNDGYIDDFGRWKTYNWQDYFDKVFNYSKRDVKKSMYMALRKEY